MKKRISIKSGKAKGRRLQQWVAKKVSETIDIPYGKDLDIDSRPMGQSGVDVILRGRARDIFPYAVECKAVEKWSIHQWIEQAKSNSEGDNWLLFCKRNHEDPIVVLDADKFFKIIRSTLW